MKQSILVLGLIASTGFAFFSLPEARASASEPSLRASRTVERWTHYDYSATDEDGNREEVKTGKEKGK